eukprot:3330882-Rhodomonas_salina.1
MLRCGVQCRKADDKSVDRQTAPKSRKKSLDRQTCKVGNRRSAGANPIPTLTISHPLPPACALSIPRFCLLC